MNDDLVLRKLLTCALGFLAMFLFGCASTAVRPATGDISFTLRWEGTADLDLHVEDPMGRLTSALAAYSPPDDRAVPARLVDGELVVDPDDAQQGVLDIDCNAGPDRICEHPIENVFWPTGSAPSGTYEIWVRLFQLLRDGSQVEFEIEVRQGKRVVRTFVGTVDDERRDSDRFRYRHLLATAATSH